MGGDGPLSVTNEIDFDSTRFVLTTAAINPAIGASSAPDKQLSFMSLGAGAESFTVSGMNAVPIPDGLLYTAEFTIGNSVTPGVYPLSGTPDGSIQVTTCTGDCNGNQIVTIAEVTRCVNLFLGQSLCDLSIPAHSCPVADENANGTVSIGEVSQCVNSFLLPTCP